MINYKANVGILSLNVITYFCRNSFTMANTRKAEVFTDANGNKKVKLERKPTFYKIYDLIKKDWFVEDGLHELDFFETPSVEMELEKPVINYKQLSEKGRKALK